MLLMHANNREDIKEAYAGDIVALAGLKEVRTGDTLCDAQKQVILEKMEFPDPVIEIAIEPKSKADQEKLGVALAKLVAEDPSFRVHTDQESGQTILKGMGELHLDIKVDILKRTYKVEANIGAPQVAYREKITRTETIDYVHKKQTGGTGQFARVKIVAEPLPPGGGFEFESKIIGDLNSRRGQIQGQDMRGNANVVSAMVPLANMFGYVSNLRSMSQGRATFTMQFDHYEQVPSAVAAEIQAKFA
jgi:elongation factor G